MVKNMKVFTYLCPSNWKAAKKKNNQTNTKNKHTHISGLCADNQLAKWGPGKY